MPHPWPSSWPSPRPYSWIDAYCLAKAGCEKEYKTTWDATLYTVRRKIFVLLLADSRGETFINLKHEPYYGAALRDEYPDILPGYHMNKFHWSSVRATGKVPDGLLREMIDESYASVLRGLPRAWGAKE